MIKVEHVEVKKTKGFKSYPVIMESIMNGAIILFQSQCNGVLLRPGLAGESVGDWSDNWISAERDDIWRPYNGKITLCNSGE